MHCKLPFEGLGLFSLYHEMWKVLFAKITHRLAQQQGLLHFHHDLDWGKDIFIFSLKCYLEVMSHGTQASEVSSELFSFKA